MVPLVLGVTVLFTNKDVSTYYQSGTSTSVGESWSTASGAPIDDK